MMHELDRRDYDLVRPLYAAWQHYLIIYAAEETYSMADSNQGHFIRIERGRLLGL